MAPNNGLANAKPKKSGSTTILDAGTVESRGMGTNINSREVISDQIQAFLNGEGKASPKAEFRAFFTVWTFVTRLPGPTWVDHHPGYLMRGMAYFPLSGLLIGIFVSAFFDMAYVTLALPLTVSSLISEAASIWVTGCFHEDGLADSADGIGGGWSRDQILKIMTDTRLGTYGCAILLLYMIAKVELVATAGPSVWASRAWSGAGPAIVVTQMLSRLTSPLLIKTRDYVDEQGPKYRFYSFMVEAKHLVTWHRVAFAVMTSYTVAALAYGAEKAFILIATVVVAVIFSGRYAEYLLGGVMGDYLGATICVTEICLLSVIALMDGLDIQKDFISYVISQFYDIAMGSVSMNEFLLEERNATLIRFGAMVLFTTIWCGNVGHPPVFVRKSVAKKGTDKEIRIALVDESDECKGSNEDKSPLEIALSDEEKNFESKYNIAREYLDSLAKPLGSLGTLEDWAARLAVLQKTSKPKVDKGTCLIFVGDHGVAKDRAEGGANCSAYPQSVTQKVLEGIEAGLAGASVLAKSNGVNLMAIDVRLNADFRGGDIVTVSKHKVNDGTKNFCKGPAMSISELNGCILAGREETKRCIEEMDTELLIFGEVGIGNTTTSSALIAALTDEPVKELCGFGASVTRDGEDAMISNKVKIVEKAMECHGASKMKNDPALALENVGGAEIAAIVGGMFEASEHNIPVLVDGFIVTTAAMVAVLMKPAVSRILFLATKSTERGQTVAIQTIKKVAKQYGFPEPPSTALDMGLRMGEGTGALLSVPILRSAAAVMSDLATLETVLKLERPATRIC